MDFVKREKDWIKKAYECYKIQYKRKKIEELEEKLFEELKELSEHKSSKGGGFVFSHIPRKGSVEWKNIPQLFGIDLDKYRKPPVDSWKLSLEIALNQGDIS